MAMSRKKTKPKSKAVAVMPQTYELIKRLKDHFEEASPLTLQVTYGSVLRAAVEMLAEREGVK